MRTHITPRERQRIRNRKRRQQVKRQLYLCGVLVTLLVVLVATYNSKAAEKKAALEAAKKEQKEQREQVSDDAAKKMEESALGTVADNETPKQRLKRVREQARQSGYPEDITSLLKKNKETVDFVEHFAENKNTAPARMVADDLKKGEIPQYLQWDERWGHASYGTGFIASCGCGPTALSMVVSGLTGDASVTPYVVAEYADDNGYYVQGTGSKWSLISEGCQNFGVAAEELPLSQNVVYDALEAGRPIICSVRPGDFTTTGHFIVLVGVEDGKIRVNDSNSRERSQKLWDYQTLERQIDNLWAFSVR